MALAEVSPTDPTATIFAKIKAAIDQVNALAGEPGRATQAEQGLSQAVAAKAAQADLTAEVQRAGQAEQGITQSVAAKAQQSDLMTEIQARQGLASSLQVYKAALLLAPERPGDGSTFFGMATSPTVISITPSNDLGSDYLKTVINTSLPGGCDAFFAAMVGGLSVGSAGSIAFNAPKVPAGGPFETLLSQWLQLSPSASLPGPGLGYSAAQAAATIATLRAQALAMQAGTTTLAADPSQFPALAAASIVVAGEGAVCRMYGGGYVACSTFFAVEPDRIYDARFAFSRSQNPADPSGDDVRLGAFLYDANKTLLGPLTLADFPQALVASGRLKSNALISRLAAPPAGVTALQSSVRYARPFVETFGGAQQTDVEVIAWRDVTELARLAAASNAALGSIFA